MSEMVERVAKAISWVHESEWDRAPPAFKAIEYAKAKIAIKSMRDPTLAMLKTIIDKWGWEEDIPEIWRAMIDAALGDVIWR